MFLLRVTGSSPVCPTSSTLIKEKCLMNVGKSLVNISVAIALMSIGQVAFADCDVGDCENGYGKYTWNDGDMYEGHWLNGQRTGKGTMTYANGDFYKGGWLNGEKHGKGEITWANGDTYKGDFFNGDLHGKGKHTWDVTLECNSKIDCQKKQAQ